MSQQKKLSEWFKLSNSNHRNQPHRFIAISKKQMRILKEATKAAEKSCASTPN